MSEKFSLWQRLSYAWKHLISYYSDLGTLMAITRVLQWHWHHTYYSSALRQTRRWSRQASFRSKPDRCEDPAHLDLLGWDWCLSNLLPSVELCCQTGFQHTTGITYLEINPCLIKHIYVSPLVWNHLGGLVCLGLCVHAWEMILHLTWFCSPQWHVLRWHPVWFTPRD